MTVVMLALLVAAGRVLEFCRAHPIPTPAAQKLVEELAALIDQLKALGEQLTQTIGLREWLTARRTTLERHIRYYLLRPVALMAQVIYKKDPARAEQFAVRRRDSNTQGTFLIQARVVLANLRADVDVFVRTGLDPALLPQLTEALAEYERLPAEVDTGKRTSGEARGSLDEVLDQIGDTLIKLDAINRHRLRDDPQLLAEWRAARTIPWPKPRKKDPAAAKKGESEAAGR